jgi:hypothetical protein
MAGSRCGRGEIFRRSASRGVGEQRLILVVEGADDHLCKPTR